jgi:tRNA-dihydrouridine synthase B
MKIPVIGNGDIACVESLKKMFATGCAGVMIGRAGVGQPWLIGKLAAELTQQDFIVPPSQEIGLMFVEHIEKLTALLNNEKFAILQARKIAKYYARHLENKADFCAEMNVCESLQKMTALCLRYFE